MSSERPSRPEVLAPAGDWEAMRAAVANGADAVYFGLNRFNARHRATNFTLAELPDVMQFLHERHVRGFVTLNTLIFTNELADAAELVAECTAANVDAVIVQDLGLARLIARLAPAMPIHASTQMTLTEPLGINFVHARLGIRRAVLARELSISEIRKITAATDVPVEVFVHGALCVAYSGQCLTSEALGGRSANRGQCAQACRLPYEMLVDGRRHELGDRAYLLSPQDLAAYEQVKPLLDAGVVSFKIEGRLKGGPYVAATTKTYRKAVDAALAGNGFTLDRAERLELEQTFSRGFTPGFLEGVNHQQLVAGRFPKSRGIFVGTVVACRKSSVIVQPTNDPIDLLVKPGDGVVFDEGRPEENELGGRVWEVRRIGKRMELRFADTLDVGSVAAGARVWKTDDPALRKKLERTWQGAIAGRRIGVTISLHGRLGSALTATIRVADGRDASACWPGPLQEARKQPLTEAVVREQLGRLGDTAFQLDRVELDLPANVMVPKSVLNDLRRKLLGSLPEPRSEARRIDRSALVGLRRRDQPSRVAMPPALHLLVRTMEQLEAACTLSQPPELILCDFEDPRRYRSAVDRVRSAGLRIAPATFRIQKPGEEGFLARIAEYGPDAILIRSLGALAYYLRERPSAELLGDFSLNVANDLTADFLLNEGLATVVPSYDLNWEQLADLVAASDPNRLEVVIHQHMPMFHMEHCVFAAFLSTGKDFRDCGRPCEQHKVDLRDRVGAEFPVIPDAGCRNTVYNGHAQSAAEYVGRMRSLGLNKFRVELLRESPDEIAELTARYRRVLNGEDDGRSVWRQLQVRNQLGVTRGTLQMA